MKTVDVWSNQSLGKGGWLFWILVTILICPLLFIAIFVFSIFQEGYQIWERAIFCGGFIFFIYHFSKAVLALRIASITAKELQVKETAFWLTTFAGKTLMFTNVKLANDETGYLDKKYLKFLFPKGGDHLILTDEYKTYYISSCTNGFGSLKDRLLNFESNT